MAISLLNSAGRAISSIASSCVRSMPKQETLKTAAKAGAIALLFFSAFQISSAELIREEIPNCGCEMCPTIADPQTKTTYQLDFSTFHCKSISSLYSICAIELDLSIFPVPSLSNLTQKAVEAFVKYSECCLSRDLILDYNVFKIKDELTLVLRHLVDQVH